MEKYTALKKFNKYRVAVLFVFIVLKLLGVITYSWPVVFAPVILYCAYWLLGAIKPRKEY